MCVIANGTQCVLQFAYPADGMEFHWFWLLLAASVSAHAVTVKFAVEYRELGRGICIHACLVLTCLATCYAFGIALAVPWLLAMAVTAVTLTTALSVRVRVRRAYA